MNFRETHGDLLNRMCFRQVPVEHWHSYVSVSDRACAEAVAELKKAPPPKCYQEKDDDAIYHLNDDRLDFTRALGYHVPEVLFNRATQAKQTLELAKEDLKEEMLTYGPKGPRWDFVEFYEEIRKSFLEGDTAEGQKQIVVNVRSHLVELELW